MFNVDIIVPVYHGKRYIDALKRQTEECRKYVGREAGIRLFLVNDAPDDPLDEGCSFGDAAITVLNTDKNRGIQGTRVRGLENSHGEYVLFLDQDDKIAPAYVQSQLQQIGEADAVVCRAIHGERLHYTNTHLFEKVISKEFMLKRGCPVVSPGQVLIKREAIPRIWKENIMEHNGADDYFLWLLMAAEGRTFALNQEVLFEHVVNGSNTSGNTNEMMDSELEMIRLLKRNHVFCGEEEAWLDALPESLRRIHVRELDNYKRAFAFWQCWNRRVKEEGALPDFFARNHIKTLAIYGAGDFGRSIRFLLRGTGVEVCCYIDQNAEYIRSDIPAYRKETMRGNVDAVIMTIRDRALKEDVAALAGCPVFDAEEIWE